MNCVLTGWLVEPCRIYYAGGGLTLEYDLENGMGTERY